MEKYFEIHGFQCGWRGPGTESRNGWLAGTESGPQKTRDESKRETARVDAAGACA
jgi:hypothetical protein